MHAGFNPGRTFTNSMIARRTQAFRASHNKARFAIGGYTAEGVQGIMHSLSLLMYPDFALRKYPVNIRAAIDEPDQNAAEGARAWTQ